MSSKSKLIIGIVLLAVGGGLIPTGVLTNNYLRDAVADGVPDALLQIKDDAVESIQEMVPTLATPSALVGARDEAIGEIEPQVPALATPSVLRELRDEAITQLPYFIWPAVAATGINQTLETIAPLLFGGDKNLTLFTYMNDPVFNSTTCGGLLPIKGISEFISGGSFSLSYTPTAERALFFTGASDYIPSTYAYSIPGFFADLEGGSGIIEFLSVMYIVDVNYYGLGPWANNSLQTQYNATWGQLSALEGYLLGYMSPYGGYPSGCDNLLLYEYGVNIYTYAEWVFHGQWANASMVPAPGFDLNDFNSAVPDNTYGLEAGIYGGMGPLGISLAASQALWDDSDPYSFANDEGFLMWLEAGSDTDIATAIITHFGVMGYDISLQFGAILSWAYNFMTTLTPLLLSASGMSIEDIAKALFYEQWANGTMGGKDIVPDGFLAELGSEFEGPPYLEVGLPDASNISMEATKDLWNDFNPLSFANGDGFDVWLEAVDNSTLQTLITDEFDITAAEFALLEDWLNDFMTEFTVPLLEYGTGYTLAEYSFRLFYEQWANGTMDGSKVLPDGFLSRRDPPIMGPPYFELGLQYPCGLTMQQTENLWLKWDKDSLVTVSGVNKWYQAKEGNTQWKELADKYGLSSLQMKAITTWLPVFRDTLVNKLAEDDMNLPMEPYDLGNTLFLSLIPAGSVLAALGVVVLILSRRS